MKKIFTLLSAMLFIAVGAWAETFTGTVGFNAQNRMTKNADGTFTAANNAGNQYALAFADLSGLDKIASASTITVEFDVTITGRLVIGLGDKATRGTTANGSNKSTYNTDGLVMRYGTTDGSSVRVNGGTSNANALGVVSHVKVTLDRLNNTYSYNITSEDGNTSYFKASNVETTVSNITAIEAYTWNNNQTFTLSDVSYSYEYTPASYNYTVKAVDEDDNELAGLASGTSTEAVKVYVPIIVEANGKYYKKEGNVCEVEASSINADVKVTYKELENAVAYLEVEKGSNCGQDAAGNYSCGYYGHVNGGKTSLLGTLEPGVYTAYAYLAERGDRGIYLRDTSKGNDVNVLANMGTVRASAVGIYTCEFTLISSTNVGLSGYTSGTSTNQSSGIDYIYIVKTGDATLPVAVNESKTASLVAPCALDFTDSKLKAYIATAVSETAITLAEVTTVAAGQAIVVKGESCDVNVIASAETTGNIFTSGAHKVEAGENIFALSTAGDFRKVAEGVEIPAGKAYIIYNGTAAKTLALNFGGEATGISNATTAKQNTAAFNLMGQKVSANAKGIVIINGKKFNNK